MLISFSMKNVLSFEDRAVLDMSAVNAYKEHPSNLIKIGEKDQLIRVATIYGANASGKTNLCRGMHGFSMIIMQSNNNTDSSQKTAINKYYSPFVIKNKKNNSEYEVIIIVDGDEYTYGFEYNSEAIVEEWLYKRSKDTGRQVIVFERDGDKITFGATVRDECQIFEKQISIETLVLSFMNKLVLDTDIFKKVYHACTGMWLFYTEYWEDMSQIDKFLPLEIDDNKDGLLNFLNAIDTGIRDISYKRLGEEVVILTKHMGIDGKMYPLNIYNESGGTLKSILVYMYVSKAIKNGDFVFIDELNAKLHPLLLKYFVDMFYDKNTQAQLAYTTHDTTLLDKKYIRRDQVFFVKKDDYGRSSLYSLSDYKVRTDASFAKDYLAGVYEGIPILRDLKQEGGNI